MAFRLPKLNVPLLAIATGAMVFSAAAQPSGQSIIFSAPQNDDAQFVTPSLAPQNSQMPVLPGTLQAPVPVFQMRVPNDRPMPPPPQANSFDQERMKNMLEERKNWTLMTPAEIFGVTTTEKLLQPPERDAMGREKTQTQLERYLDRENELRTSLTNGLQNDREDSPWNLSRNKDDADPFDSRRYGTGDAAQNLDGLVNGQRNSDGSARQNGQAAWDSFNPPAPPALAKQDPDQQATMERFRQLLEPGSGSTTPSPDSRFFPAPKPVLDPNITQPDFVPNPAGASFIPLNSGIGKPAGLSPLPGIVNSTPPPAATPAWAPQPAPWLLEGPQSGVRPQRKF